MKRFLFRFNMQRRHVARLYSGLIFLFTGFLLVTLFQNCSSGFQAIPDSGVEQSLNSSVTGNLNSESSAQSPSFSNLKFRKLYTSGEITTIGNRDLTCGITLDGLVKCWGASFGAIPVEIKELAGSRDISLNYPSQLCGILTRATGHSKVTKHNH